MSATTVFESTDATRCPVCGQPLGVGVLLSFPPATAQYHEACAYGRRPPGHHPDCVDANCVKCRAADALEHLAGENARLREALRWYYLTTTWPEKHTTAEIEKAALDVWTILQEGFNARAALGDTPAGLDRQGPLEE